MACGADERAARPQREALLGHPMKPSRDIAVLIDIMAALRTPGSGCPWDLAQTFATIAPYTLEEAYEVADAIARGDLEDLREELGDLLLQVVFHARMAQERGAFDFGEVVNAITTKLLRRHPHVFGDAGVLPVEAVNALWERIKTEEKAERAARRQGAQPHRAKALDGVAGGLPALVRALKLQDKASAVGFDWNDPLAVLAKIREEADEIEAAIGTGDRERIAGEIGDLMFATVNLARHANVDPQGALAATNAKFERRFAAVESALEARGKSPKDATLAEMDALWDAAKAEESASHKSDKRASSGEVDIGSPTRA
jgi:nucleoside triphosphate diphosphatase